MKRVLEKGLCIKPLNICVLLSIWPARGIPSSWQPEFVLLRTTCKGVRLHETFA
jgi:hypothetical protein